MAVIGEVAVNLVARFDSLQKGLQKSASAVNQWATRITQIAVGAIAFYKIRDAAVGSVSAFADAEEKANSLRAALANNGAADAFDQLAESAANLQRATRQDADDLLGVMAKLASTTGASADEVQSLGTAAVGLAKVLKTDTATAADLLTKAYNGNAEALQRYGINLGGAKTNQEQLNVVLDMAAKGLALASAETNTLNGAWEQAKNALGDVAESIGAQIAQWLKLQNTIKQIAPFAANVGPLISVGLTEVSDVLDMIGTTVIAFATRTITAFSKISAVASSTGSILYAMIVEPLKAAELFGKQILVNLLTVQKYASQFTGLGDTDAIIRDLESAQESVDEVLTRKGPGGKSFVDSAAEALAKENNSVSMAEQWGASMSDGLLDGFAKRSAERKKFIADEWEKMGKAAQEFGAQMPGIADVIAGKGDKEKAAKAAKKTASDVFKDFGARSTLAIERAAFSSNATSTLGVQKDQLVALKKIEANTRKNRAVGLVLP